MPKNRQRSAEFLKVAQIVLPVWLRHYSHLVAANFHEGTAYHSRSERGVINIGVAGEYHDVRFLPSMQACLFH